MLRSAPESEVQVGIDGRRHARATAQVRVEFAYGNTSGVGHTSDISESGIFLRCHPVPAVGTRVYLKLFVDSEPEALKLIGLVKRVVDRGPEASGIGVNFEVAYAKTRGALGGFIGDLFIAAGGERMSQHGESLVSKRASMFGGRRTVAPPPVASDEGADNRGAAAGRVLLLVLVMAIVVLASALLAGALG